jgi:M3 family oligoendopeptidase
MGTSIDFHNIHEPAPRYDDVAAEHREIETEFDGAASTDECLAAVAGWDKLRRRLATWESLTNLHFQQDTRNEEYKRAREYCDELRPKLTDLDVRMKRKLLASPHRGELEQRLGKQAFSLWEADVLTFDPAIEQDLVREAKLEAEYTELLAAAKFEFQGETFNLSGLGKFREHPDREVRYETERLRWDWFREQREALDRNYDELVKLRTGMARKLGFENFIGLGYKRMKRVDYDQHDIERYRAAIREHVVPLDVELRQRQAGTLGVDPLMYWDEAIHDPQGNPAPLGDHDWLLDRAQEMFDGMGSGLDSFFQMMVQSHLLDLKNRDGKAGGGFCTDFPSYGVPFIFANFNGTKGDVEVFTHEMGHAFQGYLSRNQPLADYLFPTYESCEIHSMSLEFLTWPHMEKFFGAGAERFRKIHLTGSLFFLPYGVAIDHFQHLVYGTPDATPAQRHAMWQEVERTYLPWRNYGDVPHVGDGGLWQLQRHVYLYPFYYIDYTLAQTCALQFWVRATSDFDEAMRAYVALCQRGGEAPFQELAHSAGLRSPFQDGCLTEVVSQARAALTI